MSARSCVPARSGFAAPDRASSSPRRCSPIRPPRATAEVERVLTLARAAAPKTEMWGGLMAYAGERELLREQVRAAKRAGCEGAILFAYDPKSPDLLDIFAAE